MSNIYQKDGQTWVSFVLDEKQAADLTWLYRSYLIDVITNHTKRLVRGARRRGERI
jgi:hypothetical protein